MKAGTCINSGKGLSGNLWSQRCADTYNFASHLQEHAYTGFALKLVRASEIHQSRRPGYVLTPRFHGISTCEDDVLKEPMLSS